MVYIVIETWWEVIETCLRLKEECAIVEMMVISLSTQTLFGRVGGSGGSEKPTILAPDACINRGSYLQMSSVLGSQCE